MTAYWTIDQYGQFNGNSNNANYASIAGYADNSGSADNISYTWFDDGNSLNSGERGAREIPMQSMLVTTVYAWHTQQMMCGMAPKEAAYHQLR